MLEVLAQGWLCSYSSGIHFWAGQQQVVGEGGNLHLVSVDTFMSFLKSMSLQWIVVVGFV